MKNFLVVLLSVAVVILALLLMRQPTVSVEEEVVETSHVEAAAPASAVPSPASPAPDVAPIALLKNELPEADVVALCRVLLNASIAGNFEAFQHVMTMRGDARMRRVITEPSTAETFRQASAVIGPPCRDGYALDALGSLVQTGHKVYLWRLRPNAGSDEFLVRLTLRGDRLAGFFFQ